MTDSEKEDFPQEEGPSKSQRKRDMTALQKLGEILVQLPAPQLEKIPLEGRLLDAVLEARKLKTHGAIRRQLQFIGRLMRDIDPAPIEKALAQIQLKNQHSKAKFHQIERWRDKLIAEGDPQMEEFFKLFPDTDSQHLRQLIRQAQLKKIGAETELFRYLREIIE